MVNWDPEAKTTLSDEEVFLKNNKENCITFNIK
jgi:valyl-tRNA synthetase